MDIKIKVNRKEKQVSLYLEVMMSQQDQRHKPAAAMRWLQERGYKVGRCVKSDVVQNKDSEEEILCKGHWIFDLLEEPVKKEAVKPEVKETSATPTPNGVQTLTAKKKTTAKSKRRKKTEE